MKAEEHGNLIASRVNEILSKLSKAESSNNLKVIEVYYNRRVYPLIDNSPLSERFLIIIGKADPKSDKIKNAIELEYYKLYKEYIDISIER